MVYTENGSVSIEAIFQSGNLYNYCMGNPVRYTDPSGGSSYKNSYADKDGAYFVTTVIDIDGIELTYQYEISLKGVITFGFKGNNYFALIGLLSQTLLAEAMYHAARSINSGFLWGRTIGGLDTELQLHYLAYSLGIKESSSSKADMGALLKGKTGYDNNAWAFEWMNLAIKSNKNRILPQFFIPRTIMDISRDIKRYR